MKLSPFALLFGCVSLSLAGSNWPQYRGPQASGLAEEAAAPVHWNLEKHENLLWRTPIPGLSHSSPILWNDRLYLVTAVRPGQASLKVGLYGDIQSAQDQESHQWRLVAIN